MKRTIVAAVLALSTLAPSLASADAYESAMARGVVARDRANDTGDPTAWDEALRDFEEANIVKPTKEAKFELANAAAHLHEDDVAVQAYEDAIALGLGGKAAEMAKVFLAENTGKMARLRVDGPKGAVVFVQARRRGELPLAKPIVVFAGNVHFRVVGADGKIVERDVTTTAGEVASTDVNAALAPPPPPPPPPVLTVSPRDEGSHRLGWTLAIGGVALGAAGVATFVVATVRVGSARDSLAGHCVQLDGSDECAATSASLRDAAQSDVDAIATWKAVRIVSGIGAGIGIVAAVAGIVDLASKPSSSETSAWQPVVAPTFGGLSLGVRGAF